MFFLLLAMMASSVLAIVLRYLNTGYAYGVYFINYVTCAVLAFATLEGKTLWTRDPTPLWLGAVAGFFYLSSLAAHGYSIHKNGAILSSVFTRVLVPIFPALLLFHGRTTPAQGLGVGLAVLAAVVMNGLPQKHQRSTGGESHLPPGLGAGAAPQRGQRQYVQNIRPAGPPAERRPIRLLHLLVRRAVYHRPPP